MAVVAMVIAIVATVTTVATVAIVAAALRTAAVALLPLATTAPLHQAALVLLRAVLVAKPPLHQSKLLPLKKPHRLLQQRPKLASIALASSAKACLPAACGV
jgi:hypothetical protein